MGLSSVFTSAKRSGERTSNSVKKAVSKAKNGLSNFKNGFTGRGRTGFFSATQKYNRNHQKKGGYAGGWAAIAFGNIINAHSSADDIVDEFGLDKEENSYNCDAYTQAYQEQYDIAEQVLQEWVDFYSEYIEMLMGQRDALISEADDLEETANDLRDEAEDLRSEASEIMEDDPEGAEELLEEAAALEQEAQELDSQAQALRVEADELQGEIDAAYDEMEMLTVEEFIDYDSVEINAFLYACDYAQMWIDGEVWIPSEVLDWAFYDVSDHNG